MNKLVKPIDYRIFTTINMLLLQIKFYYIKFRFVSELTFSPSFYIEFLICLIKFVMS